MSLIKEGLNKGDSMAGILLIAIAFVFIFSSSGYAGEMIGSPRYYRYIKDSSLPYQPTDEINYEEANNLYTYYEAYFDGEGRVVSLKKFVKGKLEWVDKYLYGATGSLESRERSALDTILP